MRSDPELSKQPDQASCFVASKCSADRGVPWKGSAAESLLTFHERKEEHECDVCSIYQLTCAPTPSKIPTGKEFMPPAQLDAPTAAERLLQPNMLSIQGDMGAKAVFERSLHYKRGDWDISMVIIRLLALWNIP